MIETIIQSLIIAAVVAGATGYVSGRVMEVKINGLRDSVKRLEKDVEGMTIAYITDKITLARIDGIAESIKRVDAELSSVKTRLQDWAAHIGWVDEQRRWSGSNRRK